MYIDNSELRSKLLQGYAGDKQAMEDFFALALYICQEHGRTHAYIRQNDFVDDYAVFVSASLWRQVLAHKVDVNRNLHAYILGLAKYRVKDFFRTHLTQHARQVGIEMHLKECLLSRGFRETGDDIDVGEAAFEDNLLCG